MLRLGSRFPLLPVAAIVAVLVATLAPGDGPTSDAPVPVSSRTSCHGITYEQVMGQRPGYGRHALRDYPARRYTCRALWVPSLNADFVPQALALDGRTAWVSGYHHVRKVADQACRLIQVSLRTGRVLHNKPLITGRVGRSGSTFCRHGGGLARYGHELWLAEKDRLWLIDTRNRHTLRVWRIHRPIYGSSVVLHHSQIGLMQFRNDGKQGRLHWFSRASLLRRGITDIGRRAKPWQVAPARARRVPPYAQAVSWWGGHGLIRTRSWNGCGQMLLPGRTGIGLLRGIQDVELAPGSRLWVVSEASARAYQNTRYRMVPVLSEYDARGLFRLRGHGRCS